MRERRREGEGEGEKEGGREVKRVLCTTGRKYSSVFSTQQELRLM